MREANYSSPAQILSDAHSAGRFQPVQFVTDCAPRLGESKYLLLSYFVSVILYELLIRKIVKHRMFLCYQ